MDGVISDTEPLKFLAYKLAFKELHEIDLPEDDHLWKGKTEPNVVKYWSDKFSIKFKENDVRKIIEKKRTIYNQIIDNGDIPQINGVVEFIKKLHASGKPLAVVTSSRRDSVNLVLNRLNLKDLFKVILTRDDISKLKPDPEGYLKAINHLGFSPDDCLIFEDSQSGVKAAKAAGAFCVGVLSCFTKEELGEADFWIKDFEELTQLILLLPQKTIIG